MDEVVKCIEGGGHYWNDPDPGDNFECTRCGRIGARNWPDLNESDGARFAREPGGSR